MELELEKNKILQAKEAEREKNEAIEKKNKRKEAKKEAKKASKEQKIAKDEVGSAQKPPVKPQEVQKPAVKSQELQGIKKPEGKKQTDATTTEKNPKGEQHAKNKQEKIVEEEKEEERRLIVPAYERNLLMFFFNKGNPFAKAMLQNGIDSPDDKIYFPLGSKPYEKVWFYRDPEGSIQGPFSCIEMFNWTIRKCFPENLEISFCNTEFVPMNSYFTSLSKTASERTLQTSEEEIRTEVQANKDGGTKKAWGNVGKPIGSLKDIQQDQFISKH